MISDPPFADDGVDDAILIGVEKAREPEHHRDRRRQVVR